MGRLGRRLERLEDRSRERAVRAVKEVFDSYGDEDLALVLAGYAGIGLTPAREKERAALDTGMRSRLPEGLLALACGIGPEGCATEEELGRRVRELNLRAVYPGGRRERLRRLLGDMRTRAERREDRQSEGGEQS